MIDLREVEPWHLRFINFSLMRGHVDNLSFWGRLTTCSYIRALFVGALFVSLLVAVAGITAASTAMVAIFSVRLAIDAGSWNIFAAFDVAADSLIQIFMHDYGATAAIAVGIGAVVWLFVAVAMTMGILLILYVIASKIAGVISDAMYKRRKAKNAERVMNQVEHMPSYVEKVKQSTTFQIIHAVLHKYCVPIRTSNSTQKEREAEWEKRWASIHDAAPPLDTE